MTIGIGNPEQTELLMPYVGGGRKSGWELVKFLGKDSGSSTLGTEKRCWCWDNKERGMGSSGRERWLKALCTCVEYLLRKD